MEQPVIVVGNEGTQTDKKGSKVGALKRGLLALAVLVASSPGYCQLNALTTKLTTFQVWMYSIAGVVITAALMWSGFMMMRRGAAWEEVKNVAIGGCIIGAAAGIGTWLVS